MGCRTIRNKTSLLGSIGLGVGVLLAGAGALYAAGGHSAKVKQSLTATGVAPTARGKVRLQLKGANGKFSVLATHLTGNTDYSLIVGGVKVGGWHSSNGGSGKASFGTSPRSKSVLLGFDPRGDQVIVRDDEDGEDVLVGDIPADDPTAVACCLADGGNDGETECEDLTSDACIAAGGTVQTVDSCLPDPCATTPPVSEHLVCCTNATHDDESEAECEDVDTQADCASAGGTIVDATSCDPNPCAAAPPADRTACCIPDDDGGGEIDCKVVSPEVCTARNGTPVGVGSGTSAATCSADPCGGGSGGGGGGDDDGGDDDGGSGHG